MKSIEGIGKRNSMELPVHIPEFNELEEAARLGPCRNIQFTTYKLLLLLNSINTKLSISIHTPRSKASYEVKKKVFYSHSTGSC